MQHDTTVQALAAAGFYYAPNNKQGSDRVVCYRCHNALFNWLPLSQPHPTPSPPNAHARARSAASAAYAYYLHSPPRCQRPQLLTNEPTNPAGM